MDAAGFDHFPHPGSYDLGRKIYKDQVFVRRDVRRRLCGKRKRKGTGSRIKDMLCKYGGGVD